MKLSQYRLNETIKVINKTDIGIRRNIIFFRESETLNNIMLERYIIHFIFSLSHIYS